MSYCIKCGVELSEYNDYCPLCNTKVVRPDDVAKVPNTDYPDYKTSPRREVKRVNRLFVGKLLSMLFFNYAAITMVVNILINGVVSWSVIPMLSIALVWFCVAYPFLRKRNSFFLLFSLDSIAVIVYLLALNYTISQNFLWAQYASLSILLLWILMSGFFIAERIKKIMPIAVYYIIASVGMFLATTLFVENVVLQVQIIFPISFILLIISLISYFIIVARMNDAMGILSVVLVDVSVACVSIDMIIMRYLAQPIKPTWSLFVIAVTVPLFFAIHTIKKGRQLRAIISKKLHR